MRSARTIMVAVALLLAAGTPALAQTRPRQKPAPTAQPRPGGVQVGGYAMFGRITFTASESFNAIIGDPSGSIFGGGARVGLPIGGLFVDVGAWRYRGEGERAFVTDDQVFPLGIPVAITVTPIELSAGWRFRIRRAPKLVPYAGGGVTILKYQETSEFANADENVDNSFTGYHALGGAEYRILRWLGVSGEASWSTVPDAIGDSGVSAAFDETDLGGTTFRVKITIGR